VKLTRGLVLEKMNVEADGDREREPAETKSRMAFEPRRCPGLGVPRVALPVARDDAPARVDDHEPVVGTARIELHERPGNRAACAGCKLAKRRDLRARRLRLGKRRQVEVPILGDVAGERALRQKRQIAGTGGEERAGFLEHGFRRAEASTELEERDPQRASSSAKRAARRPIIMLGALSAATGAIGMTEASAIRRRSIPCTFSRRSTTLSGPSPRAQVPA
jgi:hypothetical protein